MTGRLTSLWDTLVGSIRRVLMGAPWHLSIRIFRLLYGFHVEGEENVPSEGPFILALNEYSPVAMLVSGWISIVLLERMLSRKPGSTKGNPARARRMREKGLKLSEIATALGVSRMTVWRYLQV